MNKGENRKKWTKNDILIIENMKRDGYKTSVIGEKFNVTSNAIRKILSRKSTKYLKTFKIDNQANIPLSMTVNQMLLFGINNNYIILDKYGNYYINNQKVSIYTAILYIQQIRIKKNLHKMILIY